MCWWNTSKSVVLDKYQHKSKFDVLPASNFDRILHKEISSIKGLLSKWFTLRTYLSFHEVRKWKINWICTTFLKATYTRKYLLCSVIIAVCYNSNSAA